MQTASRGNVSITGGFWNKYQSLNRTVTGEGTPVKLRLIPYFAFANRGKTDMAVWLPTT